MMTGIHAAFDNGRTPGRVVIGSSSRSLVEYDADPITGCSSERAWFPNDQLTPRTEQEV